MVSVPRSPPVQLLLKEPPSHVWEPDVLNKQEHAASCELTLCFYGCAPRNYRRVKTFLCLQDGNAVSHLL